MLSSFVHKRVHFILCCLIAFALPFKKGVPVLIAVLLLNWVLELDFKRKLIQIYRKKKYWIYFILYFIFVVGLFWSSNVKQGFFELETKLSLIVFPLIFCTTTLDKIQIVKVLVCFISGCIATCLILYCYGFYIWIVNGRNEFLYVYFSKLMHPSYFSLYLNFAIVVLLTPPFRNERFSVQFSFPIILLFGITILLLSSKISYCALALTVIAAFFFLIIRKKERLKGFFLLIFFSVSFLLIIKISPMVFDRFYGTFNTMTEPNEITSSNVESTSLRINIWGLSMNIAKSNPIFGVGTGSSQNALDEMYKVHKVDYAYEKHLNAHNQFMQILISYGFLGLFFFLFSLMRPLILAIRNRAHIYCFFIILTVVFFSTESMLETEAGTIFYGFFNSFLLAEMITE